MDVMATSIGQSGAVNRHNNFIAVNGLDVTYASRAGESISALKDLTLGIPREQFCVIVGPSGCGKSTLLNVLAGLISPNGGEALIAGQPAGHPRDDIGFVFQAPTLLPWFTILDNVLLPMRVQGRPNRQEWRGKALELLETVGLRDSALRYPTELSGGMQQRVGMARALMHDPALLLMDEPFGALDALTRETMNEELQRLWLDRLKTVLFVTHSISEAVFLADRVIVMSKRPGPVLADIAIDLPRPRLLDMAGTPKFGAYASEIRQLLNAKVVP